MPVHVYECEATGDRFEEFFFSILGVPDTLERDGRSYRKIIGGGRVEIRYTNWDERPDQDNERRAAMASLHEPNVNTPGGVSMMEAIRNGDAEPPPGAKWAPRTGKVF